MNSLNMMTKSNQTVADLAFPRGVGANLPGGGGRQHTILQKFPKNCMKLKEFERGDGGGGGWGGDYTRSKFYYVDPPLSNQNQSKGLDPGIFLVEG